jgi:hypothetical protein
MKHKYDAKIDWQFPLDSNEYIWGEHDTFQFIRDDMRKLLSHKNILEDPWDESKIPAPNPWESFTSTDLTAQDVQRMQLLLDKGFITISFEVCDVALSTTRSMLSGLVPKTHFSRLKNLAQRYDLYVWLLDFQFKPKTGSRAHGLYRFPNNLPPDHMLANDRRIWLNQAAGTGFNFGPFYLYATATGAVMKLTPASQKVIAKEAYFAIIIPENCSIDIMSIVARGL